jgi:DnaJ-class molecular chaperone
MSSTCNRCNDFGIISKDEKLTIKIIPGKHYPDDLIHFVCMNNEQPGMLTGDVIVKICVKLHPYFEVFSTSRCSDLVYKCYLDEVKDTGRDKKTVNLTTLCGHVLNINIDSIGIDSIGIDSIISNESSSLTELIGEYGLWNKNGISRGKLYIRYY